ncbi:septum formation initiator family protein [Arthrobacter sp. YA7-1]|uniref:FtsB family cell division protein n=1 Tax=Arthrobacter sp. YA7-1 TaxID=2987701 RepID=UPI002225D2D8|nr:septum formation initiator family protein [Arthrobacter sp. YA7-1]UYY82550.1 septum formation initiator family protein [Arthrobacter sp. YA7-1]
MATRRPKVPRADALGRSPQKNPDSGHVIRADFGESRKATAPQQEVHAGSRAPSNATAEGSAQSKGQSGTKGGAAPKPGRPHGGGPGSLPVVGKASGKTSGAGSTHQDKDHGARPVPAKAFSGRMLALAVVMIAITIMLAPTVKIWLEKKAEISGLEADIASKQAEQASLQKQITRWQDPNYVKQQARDRINMVMPGEAGYWVFGGDVPAGTPGGSTSSGASGSPSNLPWVDGLWESIRRSATD